MRQHWKDELDAARAARQPARRKYRYHVTYFYLASGMEGHADVQDYGIVSAPSAKEAERMAAEQRHPNASQRDIEWIIGCLTAKRT